MAIITMIPQAVSLLRGTHSWVNDGFFGQISCKLFTFAQGCSMACSIFTLTALAFERFFAVAFPMWKVVTKRRTRWLIVLIWIASFAYPAPFFYAAKVLLYDGIPYCVEDWAPVFDPRRSQAIYTAVSFVFLYAVPLLVISVLYVKYRFLVFQLLGQDHIASTTQWLILCHVDKGFQNFIDHPTRSSLRPGFYFTFQFINKLM